jgi:hypothetical protein
VVGAITIVGGCDDVAHAALPQRSETRAIGRVERGMQAIGVYNTGRVNAGSVILA